MSYCPTCQRPLSCSCQIRTASNGQKVCTACVQTYETSLLNNPKRVPSAPAITPNDLSQTQ